MSARARRYWLFKSEPSAFSWDDLWAAPGRRTSWDGVRNYQARNFLREDVRAGDGVLFYHSGAEPPGVVGVADVVREAYPDPTQHDPEHPRYDPGSDPAAPRWWMVDIRARRPLERFVPLGELKRTSALSGMGVVQRGQRLSVQPVRAAEWRAVLRAGGLDPDS